MEIFKREWNSDHMVIKKILKCFIKNGCRKWRNRFKIQKFVILAEYLEQHTDCSSYKTKISKSRRVGTNCIYLALSNKWKECHLGINSQPCNLRTALENIFDFSEIVNNHGLKRATVCQIVRFISHLTLFLSNYTCILKIFAMHKLWKCA